MRAHHFVGQFADRTRSDAAALVENAELARHAARERQLLLHQQHREPFFLFSLNMMSPISWTTLG